VSEETLLERFTELMRERFDVSLGSGERRNVLHLRHRLSEKDEHEGGLRAILRRLTPPGDFGIYLHEGVSQGWWGASNNQLEKLAEEYEGKWVMILLEHDANIGHLYTPEDISRNLSAWPTDATGTNLKIVRKRLGCCREFFGTPSLWGKLAEAGLELRERDR